MLSRRAFIGVMLAITLGAFICYTSVDPQIISLLENHVHTVEEIINELRSDNMEEARNLLDSLHSAIVSVRSKLVGLEFRGQSDALTDPFVLPSGIYRVHFKTEGFGAVDLIPLLNPDERTLLFNVFQGQAAGGISVLYVSSETQEVLIQFSNISSPYTLIFEKLR